MEIGQLISVMLRAYYLTGNYRFLNVASKCYLSYKVEVKEGGILEFDKMNCLGLKNIRLVKME